MDDACDVATVGFVARRRYPYPGQAMCDMFSMNMTLPLVVGQ